MVIIQVQERLGAEAYSALMNAVNIAVINKAVMLELAEALGPRIRGGHLRRMEAGDRCDRRELKEILSDWFNIGGMHEMTQERALAQLQAIFSHLQVIIPVAGNFETEHSLPPFQPHHTTENLPESRGFRKYSESMANPVSPSRNQSQVFTGVPTSPGSASPVPSQGKRRLAFLVANTYQDTNKLNTLNGTIRSANIVKAALTSHGFQATMMNNKSFDDVKAELKTWKEEAIKDGDPEAMAFYFSGHGGEARANATFF